MHFFISSKTQQDWNATCIHSPFFVSVATLGAPILSTHTTVSSLHVDVTLPLGPNGDSIANIFARSKKGPHKTEIVYTLKITRPKWAEQVSLQFIQ